VRSGRRNWCSLADFSLPKVDRDMDFVWTLKHLDTTSWQRSSSVQIKANHQLFFPVNESLVSR